MDKYNASIEVLEKEELEVPLSDANLYVKLMAYYLVQNKLYDAKFLWKRIPQNLKTESIELQRLNELLRSIISGNIADVFKNIAKTEWNEDIKTVMEDLKEITMENIFHLIGNAYTSILDETLMELTNLPQDQFKTKCAKLDWNLESTDEHLVVYPKKSPCIPSNKADSEYQLFKLTEFKSPQLPKTQNMFLFNNKRFLLRKAREGTVLATRTDGLRPML